VREEPDINLFLHHGGLTKAAQRHSRDFDYTSKATKKRKMMRPKLATLAKTGIDSGGKMAATSVSNCHVVRLAKEAELPCSNPGILIMTEGPRMIPPMTSAMTRGWLINRRGSAAN